MTSSVRNVGTSAASSNPFTTSFLGPEHALHNKGKATNATTHKREIYSDSFIHIETPDEVIEGYGFTSNEQMTRYKIRRTSGIFPIKRDSVPPDSAKVDSVAVPKQAIKP